ncbi:iron-containing alcohol dehydrogenase [Tropicibacter sp. R16_0]|uniref:iron-containing alcohol dehydrogenase n=1 Tax=Tropicibacter sp. R16_0 TaxID=2821102 RepID=UPI001ADB1048|nr:iron-containing alcohol dehydrogenase [Tropicibacter sp. R16_0]MBO9451902.1 iron-containing alcohol dehydrogenase [Tropicibacter sp. R16_0]
MGNPAGIDQSRLLEPHDWTFPVPIAYGPGRLSEIGARCAALGVSNPLIVTDRGSRDLPFILQLGEYLSAAGLESQVFSEISPNPRDDEIGAGCNVFRAGKHDAIIAIGGGSAMDGGKAICLTANNDIDLWAFEFEQPVPDVPANQPFPTLITIPTTAGTGAETESTAMVTHVDKGMKFCIWHPDLKPALALLDPELTVGLPPHLTAWTGVDAMTHAIEAYCVPEFHPLCDGLALEGLSLISQWLPVAYREPDNIAARGGMLVGSCLAGIAFLKGLGMVHAISHMVGAEYDTQHGLTNAIILPVVMRFNLTDLEVKARRMAEAMRIDDDTPSGLVMAVERVLDDLEIPKSLAEIGVPLDCVERIAEKALQDSAAGTNPVAVDLSTARQLVEQAIRKAR